jgi:hypothetical protein
MSAVDQKSALPVSTYFLLLFILEQHRFLELQEAYIFEREEEALSPCPLTQCQTLQEETCLDGHDCAICQLEPIGGAEWVYSLGCRHQFHRWCLVGWLIKAKNTSCPLCRDVILVEDICLPAFFAPSQSLSVSA